MVNRISILGMKTFSTILLFFLKISPKLKIKFFDEKKIGEGEFVFFIEKNDLEFWDIRKK
jgi:hypothetical protein